MLFVFGLVILLAVFGAWEFRRHQKTCRAIPVRVHVNGTRGKSSVTRLIAAGLRAGGIKTFAKTTGTRPRMIFPDGTEERVVRAGKANIIEQLAILREAAGCGAEALVIECMAVQPPLQKLVEHQMIHSTVGVITNVRADHLDEMGPALEDVARSLSGTIPKNGVLFTSEKKFLPLFAQTTEKLGARVVAVDAAPVTQTMLSGFSYVEHPDNVALALAVCAHLGVDSSAALAGMQKAHPDAGVLRIYRLLVGERTVDFVNAFAANDPDSYHIIRERLAGILDPRARQILLVNSRADRIQRAQQLGELAAAWPVHRVVVTGEYTNALVNEAVRSGLPAERIDNYGGRPAGEIYEHLLRLADGHASIVGVGNIVGLGEQIVEYFVNRGTELAY